MPALRSLLLVPALSLALLGGGCAATYSGPSFDGRWQASDPELGTLTLEADATSSGSVECVLTDLHGKRYEFEASPSDVEEGGQLEHEFEVGTKGIKVLWNDPVSSRHIEGSMNYAMGRATGVFTRMQREGQDLIRAAFFRKSRPEDTRKSIWLERVDPAAAAPREE